MGALCLLGVSYEWAMLHNINRDLLYLLDDRCMVYHVDVEIGSVYSRKIYGDIREFSDCHCFWIHSEGQSYYKMNALFTAPCLDIFEQFSVCCYFWTDTER